MEPRSAANDRPPQSQAETVGRGRGRKRSSRAHEAIVAATIDLILEVGYHNLTIEAVAARAKVGKTTVYRWWPTKSTLVIEAIEGRLEKPAPELTGDSPADIRRLIEQMAAPLTTPLGRALPAIGADLADDAGSVAPLIATLGPWRAANTSVLYAVAARGDLPHDLDPHLILDMITGTIMYRAMMGRPVTDELLNQLTDLVLEGKIPRA